MARADFLNSFLDQMADAFIERVMDRVGMKNGKAGAVTRGRSGSQKGRNLDMRCRMPGCMNRSKGPRNHFLCEPRSKNPGWPSAKKAIEKAVEKSS